MFSDLAYLNSAMFLTIMVPLLLHRIFSLEGFRSLGLKSLKRVELKSITAVLLVLSMILMATYNWIAAVIKYREGFWVDQVTGLVITRPLEKYDASDRALFPGISILINLSWTLQCSSLFLLMALWNHMSKAVLNKQFMSSIEFKAYGAYSLLSLAAYPFLQTWYYFSREIFVTSLMPFFLICFQCFFLVVLTQVANFRFRRLIKQLPANTATARRVVYYSRMNNYLAVCLLMQFIGLFGIAVDALTTDALYYNKFMLDFMTTLYSFGFSFSLPIACMILYPPGNQNFSAGAAHDRRTRFRAEAKLRASQFQPPIPRDSRFASPSPSPISPSDRRPVNMVDRDTRGYFKVAKQGSVNSQDYNSDFSDSTRSVAVTDDENVLVQSSSRPDTGYADSSISFYLNKE